MLSLEVFVAVHNSIKNEVNKNMHLIVWTLPTLSIIRIRDHNMCSIPNVKLWYYYICKFLSYLAEILYPRNVSVPLSPLALFTTQVGSQDNLTGLYNQSILNIATRVTILKGKESHSNPFISKLISP